MNNLLIDDTRDPRNYGEDTVVARNFTDGIALLKDRDWDKLYLDYDLSHGGGDSRTGLHVLTWLASHKERIPANIVIVSTHPKANTMVSWVTALMAERKRLPVNSNSQPEGT
jgi:hypothetical protein